MNNILIISSLVLMSFEILAGPNVRTWGRDTGEIPVDLTNAVSVAAGCYHNLALRSSGEVVAWGDNSAGQCDVPSLASVKAVSAGYAHSLALQGDGTVVAWGRNDFGQIDLPPELTNVIAISSSGGSGYHSIALRTDGTVVVWGRNEFGELNIPQDLNNVVAIAAGAFHSLALKADGTVVAWGKSDNGQCSVPVGLIAVAIAAGTYHSLAITTNGTVIGWGTGYEGIPAELTNVVAVSAGEYQSIALKSDGSVVVWGLNSVSAPSNLPLVSEVRSGCFHFLVLSPFLPPLEVLPIISKNPRSQTVGIGSTVYLSVRVTNTLDRSFQWYFGTNRIEGATNATLILTNVSSAQSGAYTVTVSNSAGIATSDSAMLSVLPSLNINMVPMISMMGDIGSSNQLQYVNAVGPTDAWNLIATIGITNIPQIYFDVSAIGQPARFYRTFVAPISPNNMALIQTGTFVFNGLSISITNTFWMGIHEVTQGEFKKVTGVNPSHFSGDTNLPVEEVSLADAINYCALLTSQEKDAGRLPNGYLYRLPTDEEWEYACRAGTTNLWTFGDDPGPLTSYGWITDHTAHDFTHPVGQKLPNPWGLYDMYGNVWELVSNNIIRGGSAWDDPPECNSAARGSFGGATINVGFRIVLAPILP